VDGGMIAGMKARCAVNDGACMAFSGLPALERALDGLTESPGGDGLFQFSTYQNTQAGGIERFAIESRWKNNGAGRSDVIVTGGALSQPATINECWDQFFNSQFLQVSYDPSQNYGVEATACVFIPAEYSPL